MKKAICLILSLFVIVGCLTACNLTANMSGDLAGKAESSSKVEKMMIALSQNNISEAKKMMHPQSAENSDVAISQMSTYLAGREPVSIEQVNIVVETSNGTSGNVKKEQVTYTATLTDGEVISLSVVYLSDNDGDGFISFQLILGVV